MHIHLIAIGGTGMAPLACLLQSQGHRVTGSDGPLYPPMSTLLGEAGIEPLVGFDPAHLEPRPGLVVVGNAVRRDNVEAVRAEELALPRLSMPEAMARFFLADRRPLVVAGTHGKTTTTAMAAWAYAACGRAPGYLIGGLPLDLPGSFAHGAGERFVIEGDEYNAAYFDRGAKFLHYRPETVLLTSLEHDHADLYPDFASLRAAFSRLIALLPPSGRLVACGDSAAVRELAGEARCPVTFYGLTPGNEVGLAAPPEFGDAGLRLQVADRQAGTVEVTLPIWGRHNATNALGVWAAARADGISAPELAAAFGRFHGVKRRQEVVGEVGGIVVVDDFAHHPTAVGCTLEALRERFPGRRLVAMFEPRSLTAGRAMLREAYFEAFCRADETLFAPLFHRDRLAPDERLDLPGLVADLVASGHPARACESFDQLLEAALAGARAGDVLVTMSSGSFGQLPRRLLAGLEERRDQVVHP
ncbi:MAG: hypothetical protein IPJ17_04775 [Holophagales bacterium]|nr:MAG: hypothetical protein IPJ17_04775 [Holophagales bacterium]